VCRHPCALHPLLLPSPAAPCLQQLCTSGPTLSTHMDACMHTRSKHTRPAPNPTTQTPIPASTQIVLDPIIEHLLAVIESHADLEGAQRSLNNAFKLYVKTRPTASSESSRRAKALPKEGLHPLLLACMPRSKLTDVSQEAALAQYTLRLKTFRPTATGGCHGHHVQALVQRVCSV
jgi:hypothetical protein